MSFNNFLKTVDSFLYQRYRLEKYTAGFTGKNFPVEEPEFYTEAPVFREKISLPKASTNDIARAYLEQRKLSPDRFFYAQKFKEWVNTLSPVFSGKSLDYEEERIVIPLYYKKKLVGIQGRALTKSDIKYITIMLDDTVPKIYNYDSVNLNEPVYILEGPFDSEFVSNSVAMCGADLNLQKLNISYPIYVYDNEPRNKDILARMQKVIDSGKALVIWPDNINLKDINLMVLSGINVMSVIENNTFSGLEAKLKFNFWKRKQL
jgi:hypothetical protein